jgi:hypothetical protein
MKRMMASLLLLSWACVVLLAQDAVLNPFKTGTDTQLRGRIVLYDWFSHDHTSSDEFVVKTPDPDQPYARVIYKVYWGFDAPAAKARDMLDRWAFIGHGSMWIFSVHAPQSTEEKGACASPPLAHQYQDETGSGEIPRFVATPGADAAGVPSIRNLPCFILKRDGLTRIVAQDAKH